MRRANCSKNVRFRSRSAKRSIALYVVEPLGQRLLMAAGDFDPTFSGDGRAQISFPGLGFTVVDTAIAPSGKIILAGRRGGIVDGNVAVARLLSNGTLDTTFGNGGLFESTTTYRVTSVDVENNADEKVVLALGHTDDTDDADMRVARLAIDGHGFDTTFDGDGIATVGDPFDFSSAMDVIATRDGKILVAGYAYNGALIGDLDSVVIRYNSNGSLDSTFDGDGIVKIGWGTSYDHVAGANIDYTGTPATNPYYGYISVVGYKTLLESESDRFVVMRLTPNGGPDNAFDGDGILTSPNLSTSPIEAATSVTNMPGGKTVVAGYAGNADPNARNFLVARYNPNGTLDAAFGAGGVFEYGFAPSKAIAYSITTGFRGGLLVAGEKAGTLAIIALTKSGQLDTRFSGDGILTTSEPFAASGLDVTLDQIAPVRKFVVAGGTGRVARLVDVGSAIRFDSVSPVMNEATGQSATFTVSRTEALDIAETIILTTSGTATTLGANRDFNATGLLFGNGQTTSTEVTIPAGATGVTVTLTPINDSENEGDETIGFTVPSSALTYDAGIPNSTTLVVRDNDLVGGPVVIDSGFLYDTFPQKATIAFNQSVVPSFTISDLVITRAGGTAPLYSLNNNNVTNTSTVDFYNGLTDGNYTVKVKASGVSGPGGPMAADYTFGFFFLIADANRDRKVDTLDFNLLAANFGGSSKIFSQGNFNYDVAGLVDSEDFNLFISQYGKKLLPPSSPPAGALEAATSPFSTLTRDTEDNLFA